MKLLSFALLIALLPASRALAADDAEGHPYCQCQVTLQELQKEKDETTAASDSAGRTDQKKLARISSEMVAVREFLGGQRRPASEAGCGKYSKRRHKACKAAVKQAKHAVAAEPEVPPPAAGKAAAPN